MKKENMNSCEFLLSSSKPRLNYIDTLRVIACFLVILTHSNMGGKASEGIWVGIISFLGSPSSELFLSLSGTVLLPVRTSFREFYKRRFLKLIPPLITWSVITVVIYYICGKHSFAEGIEKLIFMPLRPVHGVYWFVYVIIGLYLFAPFISKWLKDASRKSLELFIILWCITLLMPWLQLFIDLGYNSTGSHYWQLNYFGGFIGYWLIGYYLRIYPIRININFRWLFILGGSIAYCVTIGLIRLHGGNISELMDNLQIGSAFLVALIYTIVQNFPIRNQLLIKGISDVAKCSFGIYLIHILVVREIVWRWFNPDIANPILVSFSVALVSMLICYLIIKAIAFLPGSKYIVGI